MEIDFLTISGTLGFFLLLIGMSCQRAPDEVSGSQLSRFTGQFGKDKNPSEISPLPFPKGHVETF